MSVQNQPSNMNEAKINNFKFEIQGLGVFPFFVTDCNIPSMTIGEAVQPNPLIDRPVPGDKITYGELSVEFIVDEELKNWQEIHDWMTQLAFPESFAQFKENEVYKDATLFILSNSGNPIIEITFIDIFPVSNGDLQFSNAGSADTVLGSASFRFRAYEINRL
jgi:hypothetical protein